MDVLKRLSIITNKKQGNLELELYSSHRHETSKYYL